MSVNSSSLADLLPAPHSNSSSDSLYQCLTSTLGISVFSCFSVTCAMLLPLPVLVLYLGYRRWRTQRSTPTAHCDIITYHCVVMQLSEFFGIVFVFCGSHIDLPAMVWTGIRVFGLTSIGQALFHLLTCVERYLAVVHPVTYRELRRACGVRIRNISIGCVWFLSLRCPSLLPLTSTELHFLLSSFLTVFLLICISFCSVSVLCALRRPGPGDQGGTRERVDQSKKRAFHTIMAIMGVLLVKLVGNQIANVINISGVPNLSHLCVALISRIWSDLPSTLVLPLLFLHRAGKLPWCNQNTELAGG